MRVYLSETAQGMRFAYLMVNKSGSHISRLLAGGHTGRQPITQATGMTENGNFCASSLKLVLHRATQSGSDGTCACSGLCHMIVFQALWPLTQNGEQKTCLLFTPKRNLVCSMITHYINVLKNRYQKLDMDKF